MKIFLVILLTLIPVLSNAQGVFRYKHLAVECSSPNGEVFIENGLPTVRDSVVEISAFLHERYFRGFIIANKSQQPIIVRWRNCWASSDRKDYTACVIPNSALNPVSGEQTLYVDETSSFSMAHLPWYDEMFSKYPKNQKATLVVSLIIGGKAVEYRFDFLANRVKE